MSDNRLITVFALVCAAFVASRAYARAKMARAHRDVRGFAIATTVLAVVIAIGLSFVVVPGGWGWCYDRIIDLYGGGK